MSIKTSTYDLEALYNTIRTYSHRLFDIAPLKTYRKKNDGGQETNAWSSTTKLLIAADPTRPVSFDNSNYLGGINVICLPFATITQYKSLMFSMEPITPTEADIESLPEGTRRNYYKLDVEESARNQMMLSEVHDRIISEIRDKVMSEQFRQSSDYLKIFARATAAVCPAITEHDGKRQIFTDVLAGGFTKDGKPFNTLRLVRLLSEREVTDIVPPQLLVINDGSVDSNGHPSHSVNYATLRENLYTGDMLDMKLVPSVRACQSTKGANITLRLSISGPITVNMGLRRERGEFTSGGMNRNRRLLAQFGARPMMSAQPTPTESSPPTESEVPVETPPPLSNPPEEERIPGRLRRNFG